MAKQAKQVVRGAGGRFEAKVGDQLQVRDDIDQEHFNEANSDLPKQGIVGQVVENSTRLYHAALSLQEVLNAIGVLDGNRISPALGGEDAPALEDTDDATDFEPHSEQQLIMLISRAIGYRNEDPIYASAGRVLGFHALPALALAAYVTTQLTELDRTPIFEYLDRARDETNEMRYQFMVDLRNLAIEGRDVQDHILMEEDQSQANPMMALSTSPLLTYLNQANSLLTEVHEAVEELRHNIKVTLF